MMTEGSLPPAAPMSNTRGGSASLLLRDKLLQQRKQKASAAPELPVDLFGVHRLVHPKPSEYLETDDAVDRRSLSMGDGSVSRLGGGGESSLTSFPSFHRPASGSYRVGVQSTTAPQHVSLPQRRKKKRGHNNSNSKQDVSLHHKRLADAPRQLSLWEQFLDDRSHMRYLFQDGARDITLTASRGVAQQTADRDFLQFNESRLRNDILEEEHRIATTSLARDLLYSFEVSQLRSRVNSQRRASVEHAETQRRDGLIALWIDDWQDLIRWLQQEVRATFELEEQQQIEFLTRTIGPGSFARAQELDRIRNWMWLLWKSESQTRASICWKELDERRELSDESTLMSSKM